MFGGVGGLWEFAVCLTFSACGNAGDSTTIRTESTTATIGAVSSSATATTEKLTPSTASASATTSPAVAYALMLAPRGQSQAGHACRPEYENLRLQRRPKQRSHEFGPRDR